MVKIPLFLFGQADLFGLVGTLHVLIFGEYMNVFCEGGRWRTTKANFRSVKFNLHLICVKPKGP